MRAASLRIRTALGLSVLVTVLWLAAAAVTVQILSREMDEVFDSALQETGQRVLQLAVLEVLGRDEDGLTQNVAPLDAGPEFYTYLVRDDRGAVLLASHKADPAQIGHFDGTGFHDSAQMRLYQESAVRGTIILTIAEPLEHRRNVARDMALALALPLVLVIPLSILGIASGLGVGLRPLGRLRDQLARRGAGDLSPLPLGGLPSELRPIAGTVNQLFQRLTAAFDAERSFAANAAHELRTPLAAAVAQLQRLRGQSQEVETQNRAQQIETNLKRLARLSEKLIQLARAEGAQILSADPHDLRMILQLVAEDFSRGSDAGRLDLDLPPGAVASTLDPDAVAIVARNLFENALRHGDGGKVRVHLSPGGALAVENGSAVISQGQLLAMSARFVRGGTLGSGLGLAIVRTIAQRIGQPLILTSPIAGQQAGFSAKIQLTG